MIERKISKVSFDQTKSFGQCRAEFVEGRSANLRIPILALPFA
jgi:hypothetical protein